MRKNTCKVIKIKFFFPLQIPLHIDIMHINKRNWINSRMDKKKCINYFPYLLPVNFLHRTLIVLSFDHFMQYCDAQCSYICGDLYF